MDKTMKIEADHVVSILYKLTDDTGEMIESTQEDKPLSYLHGHGQIIPALERALEGKEVGETSQITLCPDDGYGERNEQQVFSVPRDRFDFEVFPGQILHAQLANGQIMPLQVVAVGEEQVTLDGNHPLAGKTLNFEVTIVAIRHASDDELRNGVRHG